MFPDAAQLRRRASARLDKLGGQMYFRVAVSAALVCMHLALITIAGRQRLDLPFNSAPGETPYFSNPDSPDVRGYPRQPHYWSRLLVSRWDAQHYIGFAVRGITACPEKVEDGIWGDNAYLQCGLGWMPAYGLAGGMISDTTGLAPDIALLMLSILAALAINLIWTSKVIVDRIGKGGAYAALIAFNFYPSAFYVVTPYTEAATFALCLGAFLFVARDRWITAGLMIGAATALRIASVSFSLGLCCAAVMVAWNRRKEGDARWWRPLIGASLSGWGQVVTLVMFQIFVGDWHAYLRARSIFGDERDWSRLVDPQFYLKGFTAQHMDSVMLVGTVFIVALTARELLKRFTKPEAVFLVVASAVTFVLSTLVPHEYWGLNRYLLGCPLLFFGAAVLARKHTAVFVLWLVLCAMIYWHIELCSFLAQGHPGICPCLGRVEYAMPF